MARCFRYAIALLSLSVTAVDGSDRPQKATLPDPIQRLLELQRPQPIAISMAFPVAQAAKPEPTPPADAISPVEHLRRAADHLEAAAVGPIAEDMHRQAERLRELAGEVEEEATTHLSELRQQLEKIQNEIRQVEALTLGTQQVQLELKMVEIDLSAMRKLGFNFEFLLDSGDKMHTVAGGGDANGWCFAHEKQAVAFLDALISEKIAKVLASPTLVTMSGRPATILSGGEFPIPIPQKSGSMSLQWREFGVRAEVLPVILENGRVRLDIAPEISERDFTNAMTIEGIIVPGITTRRVNAQVEMEFGQTMVVGGLTSRVSDRSNCTDDAPVLHGIPVPGHDRLFKQVAHEEKPQEKTLIILVTPSLVRHKTK